MLHCHYRSALVSEFAMDDVVDRILYTFLLMRPLDPDQISASRLKITRYIELGLCLPNRCPGVVDVRLGLLKELHEGRDPRFTGC
jgi:hypothetical protein